MQSEIALQPITMAPGTVQVSVTCPRCNGLSPQGSMQCVICFASMPVQTASGSLPGSVQVSSMTATLADRKQGENDPNKNDRRGSSSKPALDPIQNDLPKGWERRCDVWGREYYINHNEKTTQWEHPNNTGASRGGMMQLFRSLHEPAYTTAEFGLGAPGGPAIQASSTDGKGVDVGDEEKGGGRFQQESSSYMQHIAMDQGEPGCCAIIMDTVSNNRVLSIVSIILWPSIILAIYASPKVTDQHSLYLTMVIIAGLVGSFYFVFFIACAGLCWPAQCCMGGPLMGDLIHEFMRAKPQATDAVLATCRSYVDSAPRIIITVECSHMMQRQSGSDTHTEKVVTFKGHNVLNIPVWRDVSVNPDTFKHAVDYCRATYSSVQYSLDYRLSDKHAAKLRQFKQRYHDMHKHRDKFCDVTHEYTLVGGEKFPKVVSVVKDPSGCRFQCSQFFVNNWCLWFAMYTSLYLPYLFLWKCLVRPFRFKNVKYLALDDAQVPV